MASVFYPKGKEKMLRAQVNWESDTIKAALVSTSYTYSDTHEFVSDLGALIGTAQTLEIKSATNGVFDANDVTFTALATGSTIKAIVIYKDTGIPSTSPVLIYFDAVTGLPMATNGGDVKFPWSDGAARIFSL